jgi:hypothetical protein
VAFVMPSEGIVATTALNEMCIDILATPPTGLFDAEGLPITVEELLVGDPVTVLGLLEMAPQATAQAEGDSDSSPTPFRITAVVVEGGVQGTWRKYAGEIVADEPPEEPTDPEITPVAAAAETEEGDTFSFQLAAQAEPVTIRVYSTSRIFAVVPDGDSAPALNPIENLGLEEITPADLAAGDLAIIEAVRVVLPPPPEPVPPEEAPAEELAEYRVALMLVLQDAPEAKLLRGEIESVTPAVPVSPDDDSGNAGTLTVIADADGNSVCVNSMMATVIFRLVDNGDSVQAEKISLAELVVGDRIAIAGTPAVDTCFDADLMVTGGSIDP